MAPGPLDRQAPCAGLQYPDARLGTLKATVAIFLFALDFYPVFIALLAWAKVGAQYNVIDRVDLRFGRRVVAE